jgi:hypothetical protein
MIGRTRKARSCGNPLAAPLHISLAETIMLAVRYVAITAPNNADTVKENGARSAPIMTDRINNVGTK